MPCISLLLFLLLSVCAFAQPDMRPNYSSHDTCPEPGKNRIARRIVYSAYTDNVHVPKRDSTIEIFDRKGNLVSISEYMFGSHWVNGRYVSAHYFTYDDRNRVLSDSGAYEKNSPNEHTRWISHCVYDTSAHMVIEHCDILGKQYTYFIWYDDQNEITLQYQVDKSGDTLSVLKMLGDTTIYAEHSRNSKGEMSPWDTSFTFTAPLRETEINGFHRDEKYYNKAGQLTASSFWIDETLYDSTEYTCNNNGQLIHVTSTKIGLMDFDPDYITSHTEYTYDKSGHLAETRYWEEHEANRIYITRCTYNDKGLLSEKRTTEKEGNGPERMTYVEVLIYEFW